MKVVNVNGNYLISTEGKSIIRVMCISGSVKINSITLRLNKPYYYSNDINAVGNGTLKVY